MTNRQKHTLVLDTATEKGILACFQGITQSSNSISPLFSIELPAGLQNSKFLLPELYSNLKSNKVAPKDLDCIAVGIGPGSYTGIRIGAIVAKTLSFALQIPLVGVCTLDLFIPNIVEKECVFAAVIDAKIGGVYLKKARYKKIYPHVFPNIIDIEAPQAVSLEKAASILSDCNYVVTPNAETLRPKFATLMPENRLIWQEQYPSSLQLAILGVDSLKEGKYSMDGRLKLMYMRKTQAEMERDAKQSG